MFAGMPTLKIIGLMPMRYAKMLFYFSYIQINSLGTKKSLHCYWVDCGPCSAFDIKFICGVRSFSTSSEQVDKIVDLTLLAVLIVILMPFFLPLLRSRNVLDRWADMFERNTIMATMSISMTARTKEEAIFGLSQSIQEISKLLQEYIDSKIILMNF